MPESFVVRVPVARVHRQIGVELSGERIAELIGPIGFDVLEPGNDGVLEVLVPTNRPDVRPEPYGVDDVIEEIARTFGYSNVPRHTPTWPQPGGLTTLQRNRRLAKDVLCGLGASEGWTDTFVSAGQHAEVGLTGEAVRVSNPLDTEKPYLRRSLMPGLLGALAYNAARRQGDVRLFEVGVVFSHPGDGAPRVVERAGAGGLETGGAAGRASSCLGRLRPRGRRRPPGRRVVAGPGRRLPAAERAPASRPAPACLRCLGCTRRRSAHLVVADGRSEELVIGAVGEIDPAVAAAFGLTRAPAAARCRGGSAGSRSTSGCSSTRGGYPGGSRWAAPSAASRPRTSTWRSSSTTAWPADVVAEGLRAAAGDLLESVTLFDVYRGTGIAEGARSLAYRLRFCAPDRTLTDEEVGTLRARCIEAAEKEFGAVLR